MNVLCLTLTLHMIILSSVLFFSNLTCSYCLYKTNSFLTAVFLVFLSVYLHRLLCFTWLHRYPNWLHLCFIPQLCLMPLSFVRASISLLVFSYFGFFFFFACGPLDSVDFFISCNKTLLVHLPVSESCILHLRPNPTKFIKTSLVTFTFKILNVNGENAQLKAS